MLGHLVFHIYHMQLCFPSSPAHPGTITAHTLHAGSARPQCLVLTYIQLDITLYMELKSVLYGDAWVQHAQGITI